MIDAQRFITAMGEGIVTCTNRLRLPAVSFLLFHVVQGESPLPLCAKIDLRRVPNRMYQQVCTQSQFNGLLGTEPNDHPVPLAFLLGLSEVPQIWSLRDSFFDISHYTVQVRTRERERERKREGKFRSETDIEESF